MGERATEGKPGGVDTVLHTSVATLYSNLVTRPTGRAVRFAIGQQIEQQIERSGCNCLSILDFSQVGIIDFSCADEIIAKLLNKYRGPDRSNEAYFVLQGVEEHHKEPIETVLERHNLLLVTVDKGHPSLWGPAPMRLRSAWDRLSRVGRAFTGDFAAAAGLNARAANSWLNRLVSLRVAVPDGSDCYSSLSAVIDRPVYDAGPIDASAYKAAAEQSGPYGTERQQPAPHSRSEEVDKMPFSGGDADLPSTS
jgi:hypothetical protein